ncbi:MAG: TIGR04283 family arsenosugar biosynthesis glycosyltransferase [Spirochaetota bacterium]
MSGVPFISVVIPVLGEEAVIDRCIDGVRRSATGPDSLEIIVVDADPGGGTLAAMKPDAARGFIAPRGRAAQMNAGAREARGDVLLFLHADTDLPVGWPAAVGAALADGDVVGGAFDMEIDSDRLIYRVIARMSSRKHRITRVPYGDQAIFLRRAYFERIGGYREIPLMEDVELMKRVKRLGGRIAFLDERVCTSPRRWEEEGVLYATLRNYLLQILYYAGVSPERLVRLYYRR